MTATDMADRLHLAAQDTVAAVAVRGQTLDTMVASLQCQALRDTPTRDTAMAATQLVHHHLRTTVTAD
jgi:hypothetical protein